MVERLARWIVRLAGLLGGRVGFPLHGLCDLSRAFSCKLQGLCVLEGSSELGLGGVDRRAGGVAART